MKTSFSKWSLELQDVLNKSWRCLEDIFKTSWKCLEEVFARHLQDVCKTFSRRLQDVLKMSSRHLQDLFKTFWRLLQNVLKTSSKDHFEKDIFKVYHQVNCSCYHVFKTIMLVLIKTSSEYVWVKRIFLSWSRRRRKMSPRYLQDVFIKTNVCSDSSMVLRTFWEKNWMFSLMRKFFVYI